MNRDGEGQADWTVRRTLDSPPHVALSLPGAESVVLAEHVLKLVVRQRVEGENLFHTGDESRVQVSDAPGLFQVRLEVVFFRILLAWVCDNCSQWPSATARSASKRKVHRTCP